MTTAAVYLMHNEWSDANYKVGVTTSTSRRISQVMHDFGVEPRIITCAWFTSRRAAQTAETWWHRFLKDYQTSDHGGKEWFSLPHKYVEQFISWSYQSLDQSGLTKWLYFDGCSKEDRREYDQQLLKLIPRYRNSTPRIDVWLSPTISINDS